MLEWPTREEPDGPTPRRQSTVDDPKVEPAPVWRDTEPAPARAPATLALRFTGSGSEYFRIWIVNLLLTLVTLSLYYPWAKVRRLRYFHGNTLVGDHALGFHANPLKMLRGYLLVGLMVVLYSVAGRFSPLAGLVAFLIVAAIWPALLKSSLQFRLANTSWRGLPLFVPGAIFVAALAAVPDPKAPPAWYPILSLAVMAALLLVGPWLWWNLKKYQHDHYAFGPEQTRLDAGVGGFYGVFVKTGLVALLGFAVIGVLVAVLAAAGIAGAAALAHGGAKSAMAVVIGIVAFVLAMLAVQLVPRPFFTSRMQNLLWSRTASPAVAFESRLRFWPLFGLTLKNWLLMVCTLGLYWPFAAVAVARMKLEAMSVTLKVDPQWLVDGVRAAEGEAAGDAAGDLFGLDIGL
jgi:uncharacterized membrane protein YjgN (DUF898 family)